MSEPQRVITSDGHRGVIVGETNPSHDTPRFIEVEMEDGARLHVPAELLELRSDGLYTLRVGMADIEGQAGQSRTVGASPKAFTDSRRFVLPVMVEELEVGRRAVTTGVVRVHKQVREREELVDEAVIREEVHVERVPIGQLVDAPPAMRSEGDTLIIPVLEEVLVVEKRLRLKEEVWVTWRRTVEQTPERVVLHEEEVRVERLGPDEGAEGGRPGPG